MSARGQAFLQTCLRLLIAGSAASLAASVAATVIFCLSLGRDILLGLIFSILVYLTAVVLVVPHAFLLGIPAYLLASRLWRISWWNAALMGALIGVGPAALLLYGTDGGATDAGESAKLLALCGACGAVGGFAFWHQLNHPDAWGTI